MRIRLVVVLCALPLLGGCGALAVGGATLGLAKVVGNSDAKGNMPRATALAIGQDVDPDTIAVSDAHIEMNTARWTAYTPLGRFVCSSDDNVKGPAYCRQEE